MPRRFFHCDFCKVYYDIIDSKLVVINPDEELKMHLDLIVEQEEKRLNEKPS
jgi:hypothetical protein